MLYSKHLLYLQEWDRGGSFVACVVCTKQRDPDFGGITFVSSLPLGDNGGLSEAGNGWFFKKMGKLGKQIIREIYIVLFTFMLCSLR